MSQKIDLNSLNTQQRLAVKNLHGAMLLLAGAGSGKTRVIIFRIAYLIENDVKPENILAVTFTNKAAREMRERLTELLGKTIAEKVTVSTFHSFCIKLLRQQIYKLGFSNNFTLSTGAYQIGLIRNIMAEFGYVGNGRVASDWLSVISNAKSGLNNHQDVREFSIPFASEVADVYERYQILLKQMNLLDFDDLLVMTIKLWQDFPETLLKHQRKYKYLMIDEYQDTNSVQLRLISILAGKSANICVVGDDDQSIYGWRGADLENILQFEQQFKGAKMVRLEQNYRSTNNILNAANHLIGFNKKRHKKTLWSEQDDGKKLLGIRCEDENQEGKFVADFIKERLIDRRGNYDQFAILFRSNSQSRILELQLRRARIPYTMIGSGSFFDRKEILDVISYLQHLLNPKDDMSLLRIINVPPRKIGDKSIDKLKELQKLTGSKLRELMVHEEFLKRVTTTTAKSFLKIGEVLDDYQQQFKEPGNLKEKVSNFLKDIEYIESLAKLYKPREDALRRKDNVLELISAIGEFEKQKREPVSLKDYMDNICLFDNNDKEKLSDETADSAVSLMTVHASKGLEFPVVFCVGMERGLFPHMRSIIENSIEEERRLFYVAITRAQEEVIITYAERRRMRGQATRQRPSKFLDELPEELIDFLTPEEASEPASEDFVNDMFAQFKANMQKK